ncbi:hypothetical protein [Acinetobacter dispersus]|uniref:hypothetical protein n=1 Tax=Acinetobacter dispersus TaxID=70348 RepID=UPI001F4AA8CE|nr:hypothetical protein [Acinetobacter dispersus]MCH7391839.1 hypothetical protein [Acinetobacter dispersus]
MRSDFHDVFKDAYDYWIDDACAHRYHASKSLALQVWNHRQTEVDELQKRVEELTVGCGLRRDHIKGLETELKKAWTTVDQEAHKNQELVMLLKFVKEHFEMNDLDKAMPRVYEKLEQALTPQKGGASK